MHEQTVENEGAESSSRGVLYSMRKNPENHATVLYPRVRTILVPVQHCTASSILESSKNSHTRYFYRQWLVQAGRIREG